MVGHISYNLTHCRDKTDLTGCGGRIAVKTVPVAIVRPRGGKVVGVGKSVLSDDYGLAKFNGSIAEAGVQCGR